MPESIDGISSHHPLQPEETKPPPPPFPNIDKTQEVAPPQNLQGLSKFEIQLIQKYGFTREQAKKFMSQMSNAIVAQIKKQSAKVSQSIKEMFKQDNY